MLLLVIMLLLNITLLQSNALEPPTTNWTKTYGGTGNEFASSVVQMNDGGYAMSGSTVTGQGATGWFVETDRQGNMVVYRQLQFEPTFMIKTSDGGLLIGRYQTLIKLSSVGLVEWTQNLGGTQIINSGIQTSDGGYALTGRSNSQSTSFHFWLGKTDSSGNLIWNKTLAGPVEETANSIVQTSDGGYAMAGSGSGGAGSYDFWLVKTSSSGNMQWSKTYGGKSYECAYCLVQTRDGGYALAGYNSSYMLGADSDMWLVKTDATGNPQWNKTYGNTTSAEVAYSLIQAIDGGYALAGVTGVDVYDVYTTNSDLLLVKADASGNMLWNERFGGNGSELGRSIIQTADKGYAVAGFTNSYGAGGFDFYLVKTYPEDVTPPQTTISFSSAPGEHEWYTSSVTVSLNASDNRGVLSTQYSFDGVNWTTYTGPFALTKEGQTTVYYNSTDSWLNKEQTKTELFKIDKTPPTGSLTINNDAATTDTTSVTLKITATDNASGVAQMRLSNDNVNYTAWQTFSQDCPWTLQDGNGVKTVYAQLKDNAGLISLTYSDSIALGATPPTGSIVIGLGNPPTTTTTSVLLYLTYSSATSGVYQVRYSNDGVWDTEPWEAPSATKAWNLTAGNGIKTVYYQIKDNEGLISQTYSDSIEYTQANDNLLLITVVAVAAVVGASAAGIALTRILRKRSLPTKAEPREKSLTKAEPPPLIAPPLERIVNTGFSSVENAATGLDKMVPLAVNSPHYFWFEVGPLVEGTIEVKPAPLNLELLPSGAKLKVALFAFEDEIKLTPGKETGEIQVMNDGTVKVARQVERPASIPPDEEILKQRLFFPVQTPEKEGQARLRCNIYYEQILVESRLITAQISLLQKPLETPALQSKREYTISKALNPNNFGHMEPQTLSVMLNDNGDGTHSFRMIGNQDFKESVSFKTRSLETHIGMARGALRKASWDSEEPWTDQDYRYKGEYDENRLRQDLALFAIRGYRFWFEFTKLIADKIVKDTDQNPAKKLGEITLKHGLMEFAIKDPSEASDYMFPVSMIYDYPLNTAKQLDEYTLCPAFLEARKAGEPLEETSCFKGECPSRGNETVICPSGFWGFRHSIGLPMGIGAPEINPKIEYDKFPEVDCAAFLFKTWEKHKQKLESLKPEIQWQMKYTHDETVELLKNTNPHLVYFYCEGGAENKVPYIQVGNQKEMKITPDNFSPELCWRDPKPLVFINGCRTAALDPKLMMDFVSAFVLMYHASGVIGTEIQVFEQLAAFFGEECLRRFLVKGETIGDAVRATRLTLLKQGNPLGLAYTAYVNGSIRLEQAKKPNE
jgi:hypothetical protein